VAAAVAAALAKKATAAPAAATTVPTHQKAGERALLVADFKTAMKRIAMEPVGTPVAIRETARGSLLAKKEHVPR
jgi:hypothetical protein